MSSAKAKIERALEYAGRYGQTDGDHHKMWVIDQMVRALLGCEIGGGCKLQSGYESEQGESEEYKAWVAEHCAGDDGPETYGWDDGIPP
jgi:hypothetical protein